MSDENICQGCRSATAVCLAFKCNGESRTAGRAGRGWAGQPRAWQRTEMRFMQPFKCPHFRGSARHGHCRPSDASIISLSKTFAFHLIPPSFEAEQAGVELGSSRCIRVLTRKAPGEEARLESRIAVNRSGSGSGSGSPKHTERNLFLNSHFNFANWMKKRLKIYKSSSRQAPLLLQLLPLCSCSSC